MAEEGGPPPPGPELDEDNKLFIGSLSWGTTTRSLEDAFSKFGKITDARVSSDGG